MQEAIRKVCEDAKLPGSIVFACVSGSASYGCDLPTSDIDFKGVYQADTKDVLRVEGVRDRVESPKNTKPDYVFYELQRFCQLALVGNPNILEMMFVDVDCIGDDSEIWQSLTNYREDFLTSRAICNYLGYMKSQLARLRRAGVSSNDEKWAYHVMRLGMDAMSIMKDRIIHVQKFGHDWDVLMQIRRGEVSGERLELSLDAAIHKVEEAFDRCKSSLPKEGPRDIINELLVQWRLAGVFQNDESTG